MNINFKVNDLTRHIIKPESTAAKVYPFNTWPSELFLNKKGISFLNKRFFSFKKIEDFNVVFTGATLKNQGGRRFPPLNYVIRPCVLLLIIFIL